MFWTNPFRDTQLISVRAVVALSMSFCAGDRSARTNQTLHWHVVCLLIVYTTLILSSIHDGTLGSSLIFDRRFPDVLVSQNAMWIGL